MHAEKQHFCFVFRSPTNNWFQFVNLFFLCYCREEILVTMCWKFHIISISSRSIYQSEHFKALLSALFKMLRGCLVFVFFNIQIPSFEQHLVLRVSAKGDLSIKTHINFTANHSRFLIFESTLLKLKILTFKKENRCYTRISQKK